MTVLREMSEGGQPLGLRHSRMDLEKMVMNISTRFINLESSEVGREIHHAIQVIGETAGMDHGYIYLFNEEGSRAGRAYGWSADPVSPGPMANGSSFLCAFSENFRADLEGQRCGHFVPRRFLPSRNGFEKEILQSDQPESLILIPMIAGKDSHRLPGFRVREDRRVLAGGDDRSAAHGGRHFYKRHRAAADDPTIAAFGRKIP